MATNARTALTLGAVGTALSVVVGILAIVVAVQLHEANKALDAVRRKADGIVNGSVTLSALSVYGDASVHGNLSVHGNGWFDAQVIAKSNINTCGGVIAGGLVYSYDGVSTAGTVTPSAGELGGKPQKLVRDGTVFCPVTAKDKDDKDDKKDS